MKISILMPTIRTNLLEGVYNSIEKSFSQEWEMVLIGPYDLPDALKDKKNIVFVKSFSNPIRCRQIGLIYCTGDYICYAADDVTFYPGALDLAYEKVKDQDYKTLVIGKYCEANEENPLMRSDIYWDLWYHAPLREVLTTPEMQKYLLINTGLISRKFMLEIGGFDCQFEACAMACVDLSIRLQNDDAKCILQNEPLFHSTHLPGLTGDHAPIDRAQITHDQPLFFDIYRRIKQDERKAIDINNWKSVPDYWERRFGKKS